MQDELRTLSGVIVDFLGAQFDRSDPTWWNRDVIGELTYQQASTAREHGWTTLRDLDLAALLRVTDRHWEQLRRRGAVRGEARNWLKEAQSIRNRWAHAGTASEPDPRDAYRDLDTVARLADALGASAETVASLTQARDRVLEHVSGAAESAAEEEARLQSGALNIGDQVRLVARPEMVGAVIGVSDASSQPRYRVFHTAEHIQEYYADQLEPAPQTASGEAVDVASFHAGLSSAQLRHPSTHFLYSLFAGRIEFEPYQFRPVLKLIQSDRPRLLIADDVGVGKTIEAGLIMKELQARQDLNSVLVICPKPLVAENKWREELKRFDEDFVHLDGAALRECLDETVAEGVWPRRARRAILPFSLLDERLLMGSGEGHRRRPGFVDLDPPPTFDLVIVDEAHHIRNRDTWRYRNIKQIIAGAEAVVFMSGTPIQTSNDDLFTLLSLLRPDQIPGKREFEQMLAPNEFLHAAAAAARAAGAGWQEEAAAELAKALSTEWGLGVLLTDPKTQRARDLIDGEGDISRVAAVRALEGLNTFSGLINRTRRRDIGDFTVRKPETIEIDFTAEQQSVYDALLDLCARVAHDRNPGQPLSFLLSTLRRQAASCLNGLGPFMRDLLERRLSVTQVSESDLTDGDLEEGTSEVDPTLLAEFLAEVDQIVAACADLGEDDPKFDALAAVVADKLTLENNKLLVFSTFRHTLAYLYRRLGDDTDARVGVVHGDVPDEDRRELRRRFKLPKSDPDAIDVMLSSEVGTEGLDYQFCDALVSYDLPWNPMRVEQRIGRIDRRGQRSASVSIKNLITAGTVDAEIYHRCLLRIGVFQRALGGSEEILGDLTREIRRIADDLTLTPKEQAARLQQQTDNQVARIQELAALEQQQAQLFGLDARQSDDDLVDSASSPWLRPERIADLVGLYLADVEPGKRLNLRSATTSTLRPSAAARIRLLADFRSLPKREAADDRWERWLRSSTPTRLVTIDQEAADDRRDVDLLSPTHPLVRAASHFAASPTAVTVYLTCTDEEVPPGRYPFGIYGWNRLGVRDDYTLQPIAADPNVQGRLLELLASGVQAAGAPVLTAEQIRVVETRQESLWADTRALHRDQVTTDVQVRLASLRTTHSARVALLEEQLAGATHTKIQRMKESELAAADADFNRRAAELSEAATRCDLTTTPLSFGIVEVAGR